MSCYPRVVSAPACETCQHRKGERDFCEDRVHSCMNIWREYGADSVLGIHYAHDVSVSFMDTFVISRAVEIQDLVVRGRGLYAIQQSGQVEKVGAQFCRRDILLRQTKPVGPRRLFHTAQVVTVGVKEFRFGGNQRTGRM